MNGLMEKKKLKKTVAFVLALFLLKPECHGSSSSLFHYLYILGALLS